MQSLFYSQISLWNKYDFFFFFWFVVLLHCNVFSLNFTIQEFYYFSDWNTRHTKISWWCWLHLIQMKIRRAHNYVWVKSWQQCVLVKDHVFQSHVQIYQSVKEGKQMLLLVLEKPGIFNFVYNLCYKRIHKFNAGCLKNKFTCNK